MNIGDAASSSGISSKMIRHYEAIGLISPPRRSEAGYRLYDNDDVAILKFIKSARSLGFSLEQIKELLSLWCNKDRASAEVKTLALEQIAALTEKIDELSAMRSLLQNLAERCHGDAGSFCPIIESLTPR